MRSVFAVSSWIQKLIFLSVLIAAIPSEALGDTIEISQNSKAPFESGQCHSDALEILNLMATHRKFDMQNVRTLCISNAVISGREWRVHFALYDGNGSVYDPSLEHSKIARAIPLRQYLESVSGRHSSGRPTEVRTIAPDRFLKDSLDHPVLAALNFAYGMSGMESYSDLVSARFLSALDPIQSVDSLPFWLARGCDRQLLGEPTRMHDSTRTPVQK